jgi:hypothetical protein
MFVTHDVPGAGTIPDFGRLDVIILRQFTDFTFEITGDCLNQIDPRYKSGNGRCPT